MIRALIAEGVDAGAIRSRLVSGIKLQDGREVHLTPRAAAADVREVSIEFGQVLVDDDLLRIEVTAAVLRIKRNGMKAAAGDIRTQPDGKLLVVAKPDLSTAIYADRTIVDLAGRFRPDLYERATGRKATPPPQPEDGGEDADLRDMPLEDLIEEQTKARSRLRALGLDPDDLSGGGSAGGE